jgi:glycosyltransferase involved in cell wall biosynthesis
VAVSTTSGGAAGVVVASLMRPEGASGVQSHVRGLLEHAQATGVPMDLVTPFSSGSPLVYPAFGARRVIESVSPAAGVWWYRRGHQVFLQKALRQSLADPRSAVVYAQCPVSAAAALQVRTDERVVMVVHFAYSQAEEWASKGEIGRGGRVFASIKRLEHEVLPALDGLVFVSQASRDQLHERMPGLEEVPSAVVPNFVHVGPLGKRAPDRDIVAVGALEPNKNQRFLLEVLARAARAGHRYTLTIVGEGPDRGDLERLAGRLGLLGQVRFTGYVRDPRAIVRRHRVLGHAAKMESFGMAVVEAMAEGVPVAVAPVGGLAEIVRPGLDGVALPLDDLAGATGALISMLEEPGALERMGLAAYEHARKRFATEVVAPRLLEFLDRPPRRRPR